MRLKGVILAGGLGSRLFPLTKVTNKHLLPVYNKPMIYYPLETLVRAGIRDIVIVTGGTSAGDFMRLLGNGKEFGLSGLTFTYQEGEGGIAQALSLTERFVADSRVVVILGDNLLQDDIKPYVQRFQKQAAGARILLKEVDDAERFGVAKIENGRITKIVEKPKKRISRFAVTGVYMYDEKIFEIIKTLRPSARNELEITDVNNAYLKRNCLEFDILQGYWSDAGTFDSLLRANRLVAAGYQKRGKKNG
jgi:glucose-1-phosphate thymidylyltransferase